MTLAPSIAKLTRPRLHQALQRERLFDLLDAQRARSAIWVSAPPGAGKTTLIVSYLEARELPGIWYQVDQGDTDPATFFHFLTLAMRHAAIGEPLSLPLFQPEHLADLRGFARRYFREAFQQLGASAVVVLDNYQEVPLESAFHDVVVEAVEQLPAAIKLIVISRSEPPPHYARPLANGIIGDIASMSLRLDRDETAALANARQPLDPATLDTLHEQANGWAAGVVLLAEHVRRTGTLALVRPSGSRAILFAYFAGEVFAKVGAEMRSFLIGTAFLPKITAAMAETLSGNPGAVDLLDGLHQQHWFTERRSDTQISDTQISYQYHALFREFLVAQAVATLNATELTEIKRRTAVLLAENAQPEAAASLFAEIADWPALTGLIVSQAQALMTQGRLASLRDWIAYAPEAAIMQMPWLLYWRGRVRMSTDPSASLADLERAFALFNEQQDPAGLFASWASIGTAIIWDVSGNLQRLDPWMAHLDHLRTQHTAFSHPEIDWLVAHTAMSILFLREPAHPTLDLWEERALSLARQSGNIAQFLPSLQTALHLHMIRGDHTQAALRMAEYPSFTEVAAHESNVGFWYFGKAQFQFILGNFEACLQTVAEGLAESQRTGIHIWDHQLLAPGISSALALGRTDQANKLLAQFAADPSSRAGNAGVFFHICSALCASACNDPERALSHAQIAVKLADAGWSVFAGVTRLGLALALHDHGEPAPACDTLTSALAIARTLGSRMLEHICRMVEADFAYAAHDYVAGDAALREGLHLGSRDRYTSFAYWRCGMMARLCARALEIGVEVEYVHHIIRARTLRAPAPEVENWPWPVKVYTLGRFSLVIDGEPVSFARKAQKKPLALLHALIALGGRDIDEQPLAEALASDGDGETLTTLSMTLLRLRKLLGHPDAVTFSRGKFSLEASICWVDAWAFERGMTGLGEPGQCPQALQKALLLYRGPLLAREPEQPWMLAPRERLHGKYLRGLRQQGDRLEGERDWEAAAHGYQCGIEHDPASEDLYRRLMRCHQARGEPADAIQVYQRCRSMLSMLLGVSPSAETEALRKRLVEVAAPGTVPGID